MGQFTNGVMIGLGLGLLFAPKKGKDMRVLLTQRLQTLRGNSPENEVLRQQVHHEVLKQQAYDMAERLQQSQDLASRAAEMGGSVQNDLNAVADQARTNISSLASGETSSTRPNQTGKSPL